jgi:hypothetical protein
VPPITINPTALLKSLEEQYANGIAQGVSDPSFYSALKAQIDIYVATWQAESAKYGPDSTEYAALNGATVRGTNLSQRLTSAVQNAGLVTYSRTKDNMISANTIPRSKLDAELNDMVQRGVSLGEVAKFMQGTGQYTASQIGNVVRKMGDPNVDPGAGDVTVTRGGKGETPIQAPGDGSGARSRTAPDLTNSQTEFERGFAQFTRGLTTDLHGKTPLVGALNNRYDDLYKSYLGAMEAGKADGSQPANLWKEEFATVPGEDPNAVDQYGNKTGGLQLRTVRPTISVFDWLAKNVDPEDVYASTEPRDRPGASSRNRSGFVGYVSRQ